MRRHLTNMARSAWKKHPSFNLRRLWEALSTYESKVQAPEETSQRWKRLTRGTVSKPLEVLLIEDNAGDILLIHQVLAGERFPVSIHVAVDGKQAMQMLAARQFEPDLVILDLNLPKISGLSFLECTQPDVPVVVFTSSNNPLDRQSSFELGAKDYVQKPTDLGEFAQVVSQMVRNWGYREGIPRQAV